MLPDRIDGRGWAVADGPGASFPAVFQWDDSASGWVGDVGASRLTLFVDPDTGAVTESGGALTGDWSGGVDGRWLTGAAYVFVPSSSSLDPTRNLQRVLDCVVIGLVAGCTLRLLSEMFRSFTTIYRPFLRV